MHQSWIVSVDGKAYGPYSFEQMRGFIAEGRLVAGSLIGAPGAGAPYPADVDPVLGPLFAAPRPAPSVEAMPAEAPAASRFGRNADPTDGEMTHYIILTDIKSHSVHKLEEAIFNLGQAYQLLPQVWILTSVHSLNAVRGTLTQRLGTLDTLFVVDTSHDKAAWYNFGPEADARIRRVWKKPDTALRRTA